MLKNLVLASAFLTSACATSAPTAAGLQASEINWAELPAGVTSVQDAAWLTRSPDGRVILFGRHQPDYSHHHIFMTQLVNGAWSDPVEAPFTRGNEATAPHFAPDGRSVLFVASWDANGQPSQGDSHDSNVWRVSWDGANWGAPTLLPAPINSPAAEIDVSEVNGGVIYFTSMRAGGAGPRPSFSPADSPNGAMPDMYRATPDGAGGYRVEPLVGLNTEHTESTMYVPPDQSLILFHRSDDPVGLGKDDLFAARRQGAGWGPAIHLGAGVNTDEYEYGPELSHDGSTLYYTTHSGGHAHLLAVSLAAAMGGQ